MSSNVLASARRRFTISSFWICSLIAFAFASRSASTSWWLRCVTFFGPGWTLCPTWSGSGSQGGTTAPFWVSPALHCLCGSWGMSASLVFKRLGTGWFSTSLAGLASFWTHLPGRSSIRAGAWSSWMVGPSMAVTFLGQPWLLQAGFGRCRLVWGEVSFVFLCYCALLSITGSFRSMIFWTRIGLASTFSMSGNHNNWVVDVLNVEYSL